MDAAVEVLVVGGGVTGALIARALTDLGYQVILIEERTLGAGQSGHAHGYLHRGYIYLRAEAKLVQQLRRCKDLWDPYLQKPDGLQSCTDKSLIMFEDLGVARFSSRMWDNAGLPVIQSPRACWPDIMDKSPVRLAYETDEPSFDFTTVIEGVMSSVPTSRLVKGEVKRLILRGGQCIGAEVNIGDRPFRLEARYVVLAAGLGNGDIISSTFGRYRCVPNIRTSFMLILKGDLPRFSAIAPENRYYGTFIVSRAADATVWLVSNYLSYGGLCEANSIAARTWLRATGRALRRLFPPIGFADLLRGLYVGAKAEFRRDPERLPEDLTIEDMGLRNVCAVWPTKLSLAPLSSDEVVHRVNVALKGSRSEFEELPMMMALDCGQEYWTQVDLSPPHTRDVLAALDVD